VTDQIHLDMVFDATLTDPERLVGLLEEFNAAGLDLTRVDDVEPVKKEYSEATVRQLLTVPPVTQELPCRILVGRCARGSISIRACIPKEQGRGSVNGVGVTLKRPRRSDMSALLGFFEGDFLRRHSVAYAFLDTWPEYVKQHVSGTINERLPGVFWLNWLSRRYVEAFGEDVVLTAPWFRTARVADGLACWLYESLDDVPDDRADRVSAVESALGQEKFVRGGWQNIPQLAVVHQ
jgi:hypothetical protein